MAKKLDKEKPFGHIYGSGAARFEQGGAFFDIHGQEVALEVKRDPEAEARQAAEARQKELEDLRAEVAKLRLDPKSKAAREAHEAEVTKLREELARVQGELEEARKNLAGERGATSEETDPQASLLDDQIAAQGQLG